MLQSRVVNNGENRPGGLSKRKYGELTKSWHRRNRQLFIYVGAICGGVVLASLAAWLLWPSWGWLAGFFGGGATAFFLIAWWSPPGWVENWQQGASGEQKTAKALQPLVEEGWVVLHDLPATYGNIDHIVIGPGGVFVLDSKNLGGTAHVEGGEVTVQRYDSPDLKYRYAGTGHLVGMARETREKVLAATRISQWVTPGMVFWNDFPQRIAEHQRCHYVHGDELADWLRAQPPTIAVHRLGQVADAIRAAWEQAPTTP